MMIKRDPLHPTRYVVEPPLYGNYVSKYSQGRNNYNLTRDKLQNTPRSDRKRSTLKYRHGQPRGPPSPFSWRSSIPRGTDVCMEFGRGSLSSSSPNKRVGFLQSKIGGNQSQNGQMAGRSKKPTHSAVPPPSPCASPRKGKKYFNVMWDPRIARGSTLLQFTEAQTAKCNKYELDLNRSMIFRQCGNNAKSRRRQSRCDDDGNIVRMARPPKKIELDASEMKVVKEPLSYSTYAQFLTETVDIKYVDRGQSMAGDRIPQDLPVTKSLYPVAPPKETQTEITPCAKDTTEWIVKNLKEKTTQQAMLEIAEEEEIELIRGEQQSYEMEFLYRRWQEMKEDQWKDWLAQYNLMRVLDIGLEEINLEKVNEVMEIIAFAKCARRYCFSKVDERLKTAGFLSPLGGISFEEMDELERATRFQYEGTKSYAGKSQVARNIVDSVIVQAAVSRFSFHMHDDFGKPHGPWLTVKKHRNDSFDFDKSLQEYLEIRMERRGRKKDKTDYNFPSIHSDFDPKSIIYGDILNKMKTGMDTQATDSLQLGNAGVQMADLRSSPLYLTESEEEVEVDKVISPSKLGRKTGFEHGNAVLDEIRHIDHELADNDVDVLFRRRTSWSTLEKLDGKHPEKDRKDSTISTISAEVDMALLKKSIKQTVDTQEN